MAHQFFVKNYELIEHTADVGIRVKGKDLKELFQNAALAMFDVVAEKLEAGGYKLQNVEVNLKAQDLEELLVNWLNELLSLSAVKGLIFSDFKIKELNKNKLEAVAFGGQVKNYKVNSEIKAATYHSLKLEEINDGWQAEVIFDV